MHFSFQSFFVAVVVTAAHVGALLALKPVSEEASQYFSHLPMDQFVEEVLVKKGPERETPEVTPETPKEETLLAVEEESTPEIAPEDAVVLADAEPAEATEIEDEIDISEERDSVAAVADVRSFAGRIHEPALVEEPVSLPETVTRAIEIEEPVAEPARPAKVSPPKKIGPLEIRAIQPVTRS